jgi:hypothetical protein
MRLLIFEDFCRKIWNAIRSPTTNKKTNIKSLSSVTPEAFDRNCLLLLFQTLTTEHARHFESRRPRKANASIGFPLISIGLF